MTDETELPAPEAAAADDRSPKGVVIAVVAVVVVVAIAAIWVLSGNDDGDDVSTGADGPISLDGRSFRVDTITEDGKERPVIDAQVGGPPVMTFGDGRVSVTGCNGAGGDYTLDGDRLQVEEGPSTTMACIGAPVGGDPATGQNLMDQDAWFTTFLTAGPRAALDGKYLTLTTDDAEVRLTETATAAPVQLWGNRWEFQSIGDGDTASSPASTDGTVPVLDATTEGQLSFRACNTGSGAASLEDGRLVLADYAVTEMACEGPTGAALMDLDAAMAALLQADPTVSIDGTVLALSDGTTTATFRRLLDDEAPAQIDPDAPDDPDAPVSSEPADGGGSSSSPGAPEADVWGNAWTVTELCDAAGACVAPVPGDDGTPPVLDLTNPGRVSFTGCNGGSGDASVVAGDDGTFTFEAGPMVSTKMACVGDDGAALMAQDTAIAALLEAGPTLAVDGDGLTLTSADAGSLTATRR